MTGATARDALACQLDLFTAGIDPIAALHQQARDQQPPATRLFHPQAGHHAANLTMFGIRGFRQALCPTPIEPAYRPGYLETAI